MECDNGYLVTEGCSVMKALWYGLGYGSYGGILQWVIRYLSSTFASYDYWLIPECSHGMCMSYVNISRKYFEQVLYKPKACNV